MAVSVARQDRIVSESSDNRNPFERDRDRILYTTSFHRLAHVTQVVSADSGHVFHNRLTHSLQVAQVGRRMAERLKRSQKDQPCAQFDLEPDVVEAACLAHDLGHPPFGHVAELLLDELATAQGLRDGFEGNAQSFRIVAKLAVSSANVQGLNLTRATLNAILKYPWLRGEHNKIKDKWGAYSTEAYEFAWARQGTSGGQSLEANVMDIADDITYSVHDMEDFYRAGVIPLDRLSSDRSERRRFYEEVFSRRSGKLPADMDETYLRGAFDAHLETLPELGPYTATMADRQRVRRLTSALIGEFVCGAEVREDRGYPYVFLAKKRRALIFMLKQLTWHYVIKRPELATHQEGQRTIIKFLFERFNEAICSSDHGRLDLFPISVRESLEQAQSKEQKARLVIDFIASLTEDQAVRLFHRLNGTALGSALVHSVR